MVSKLLPLCASAGASFTGQKGDDDGEPGFMIFIHLGVKSNDLLSVVVSYRWNHSWNIQLQALTGNAATALASLRPFLEFLEVEATSFAKSMEMKDEEDLDVWARLSTFQRNENGQMGKHMNPASAMPNAEALPNQI